MMELLVFYLFIALTAGEPFVSVELRNYANPTGSDVRGACCDGTSLVGSTCLPERCDHRIKVCVSDPAEYSPVEKCGIVDGPPDQNVHNFTSGSRLQLPLVTWPTNGEAKMTVFVYDVDNDVDGSETVTLVDDMMLMFYVGTSSHNVTLTRGNTLTLSGTRHPHPT
ncbi:hypothetical protein MAR_037148, partial [Mya arenaria]